MNLLVGSLLRILIIHFQIAMISSQQCLTRSGQNLSFWLLCIEVVASSDAAKQKCQSYNLNLAKRENLANYAPATLYSFFIEKSSIQNQITEMSLVFERTLNSFITEQSNQIEMLKCQVNVELDNFTANVNTSFSKSMILNKDVKVKGAPVLSTLNANLIDLKAKIMDFRQTTKDTLNRCKDNLKFGTLDTIDQIKSNFQIDPNQQSFNKQNINTYLTTIQFQNIQLMTCLAGYDIQINLFKYNLDGFFQNDMYQDNILKNQLKNVLTPKLVTDLKNFNEITISNLTSNVNFIRTRLQSVIGHFSA